MQRSVVALKKHLRDTRACTEVAVYLERRMGVEEVGIGPSVGIAGICRKQVEQIAEYGIGVIAVEKTRPKIDFPSQAPSKRATEPSA